MRSGTIYAIALFAFFQSADAQITPYQRPTPAEKINNAGVYPKLRNTKAWDGREPGSYNLRFKINGTKPKDTMYIADYHLDGKYLRDTAVVDSKGYADFKGDKKLQRGMYLLVLPGKRGYFEFVVDDDQEFSITADTAYYSGDYYSKMKVNGSVQNTGFLNYQLGKASIIEQIIKIDETMKADTSKATRDALSKTRSELMEKKNNYDQDYIKANPDHLLSRFLYAMIDADFPTELPTLPDGTKDSMYPYRYYKTHYWDHVDLGEDGLVRLPVNILKQKLDLYFDKVLLPDADSCIQASRMLMEKAQNSIEVEKYLIWYLTNRFESSNIMGLDKAFVFMALETYCKGKAWWSDSATIDKMCENAHRRQWTLIGEIAPPLELQDSKGNWVNTTTINGPYTIMIFWDPTCGHCREVMPKLAKIYNENKAKGWKVIALYPNDKKKEWAEYMKEHPDMSEFTHLIRGEVKTQYYADQLYKYYVIASPTIFLLDSNKKILANRIDIEKLVEFIEHSEKMAKANAEKDKTN